MAFKAGAVRFYETLPRPQVLRVERVDGMSAEEIAYVSLNNTAIADSLNINTAIFLNKSIATPPPGFAAIAKSDFEVYLNGRRVPENQVTTIQQVVNDLQVTIDTAAFLEAVGVTLSSSDEVVLVGKFNG